MKPVISVIVPVYNAEEYLSECINSIITQNGFENAELILVDDGSTDVSSAVCSMYSERFDNVVYCRQENSGVSAARNRGIDISSGEFIMFADADDFLLGGTLENVRKALQQNNPDFLFFNYRYEYADAYNQITFPFEKDRLLDRNCIRKDIAGFMLSDSSFNSVWNKVFRKEIIEKAEVRFSVNKKYGEDKEFVLSYLLECNTAFYLDVTGYFYRYVESGAIQKARSDYFSDLTADYRETIDIYKSFDVDPKEVAEKNNRFFTLKIISAIEMAYRKCEGKSFDKILRSAKKNTEFYTLLKELYEGEYFDCGENRTIAKYFISGKICLIRLLLNKNEFRNKIYQKFINFSEKEPFVPEYDNKEVLDYPYQITVFTPVYNRSRTIHRVFDSLMEQTDKNFEWLIVDDGSTDNLKEIIDGYKNKSDFLIRYYYKPNGGKHTAVNWAYKLTDSEYFITVDSDDALLPQAVERFLALWNEIPQDKRNEYWSVVARCRNARNGEMKGGYYPDGINELENPDIEAAKIDGDKLSCSRTEVLKQFPFPEPEGTTFITESVVWNRINRSYKQYYTNEVLHDVYANEEDSLSFSWFKNHIKQGYVSNYFWMCSQLNESYDGDKLKTALKLGYYGYVSEKTLKEIRGSINSKFYRFVCTLEFPFLFIIKKLRYDKFTENQEN